jgi:hypothetical protein
MAPAVFSLRLSAAGLAQGLEVFGAVEQAKRVVTVAIEDGLPLAAGHGPANPLALLKSVKPARPAVRGRALMLTRRITAA